jgi:gluconate 2-dehydrogenase gamma chain
MDTPTSGTEETTLSDNPIGASYLYLLEPEIRFLEAAVGHLIPTDELGPGARDAGVVVYIDRQLFGARGRPRPSISWWPLDGGHAAAGLPIALHAARVYRIAIREINRHCIAAFGRPF